LILGKPMALDLFRERIDKIFRMCGKVDKVLIMNTSAPDPNFLYVTGFTSGLFEYSCLILEGKKAKLITSALECDTARQQAPRGMEIVCVNSRDEVRKVVGGSINGFRIGINESFMPVQSYKSLKKNYNAGKFSDVSFGLSEARLVKDADEIAKIKKAASMTKWALMLIQKEFRRGMTEMELGARFDALSSSVGSEGPSFKTIVCFGKNAAMPHHFPDGTKLEYGDIILIDAGAKSGNYCSDMTRTFVFGDDKKMIGRVDEKEEIMKVVKEAQVKAIRAIKPGVKGKEIDRVARKYIESFEGGKYKGRFIHSLGHSLGIEVHDGPGFSPNEETVIKAGMVITVEPGIYINGFCGVRIEDDVLVTKDGALVL
jgi:Xaa-Pro dipeptidase